MPSQLDTSKAIIADGIFDALQNFAQLEERISKLGDQNTKILGDAFEIFIEGYIATQQKFQVEQNWVVGKVPLDVREQLNLSAHGSLGIDGTFRSRTGDLVPYQVKFRSGRPALSYNEVASFLGITERARDRIIFTNCNDVALDANNRDGMRSVRGVDLDELTVDDFAAIEAWLKEKPAPLKKLSPRRYQQEAIDGICSALSEHDRATAVLACGTGKTLIALWAVEKMRPKSVLVLLPSLTLVQQTMSEWSRHNSWGDDFTFICVCSDKTVANNDDIQLNGMDVDFPVSTDPSDVRSFLERSSSKVKIVFSTYQSSPIVAEGVRGLSPFDIAVFDEAHKTTGPQAGLFATALLDEKIDIKKRIFLTATPRHYQLGNRDKDGNLKVVSMDDQAIYGPRAYTLTFGEAARQGIICDYKVIVAVVEGAEVNQFYLKHGITLVEGEQIGSSWVAKQIAVQRAIEETAAKRAISFHSRVSMAKEFASSTARGIGQYLEGFVTFHANGEQKSFERKQILNAFRDAPKALITNARCLTEGIDIPAVDMVAFVDPRSSRVDIAQAAGRAMRKPRNSDKTVGYVVVPLFVERDEGETIEEALERTNYIDVMAVLNAMREQDDELTDIIQQLRQAAGRGEIFNPKALADKVQILGPEVSIEVLQTSIFAQIVEQVGDSWDSWFGRLQAFKAREGHCRVPGLHKEGEFRLGTWVGRQRANRRDQLTEDRRSRLDALGFVWDALNEKWERGFSHLEVFKAREGHCGVAQGALEGSFRLGSWVRGQRTNRYQLTEDCRRRLDHLGFVWDPLTEQWEEGFSFLLAFKDREGHCRVPKNMVEGEFRLGSWVGTQRIKRDQLTEDRRRRLDALGFVWDALTEKWEEGFSFLLAFKAREGHCGVAQGALEGEFTLGTWAGTQRKARSQMTEDRRSRLDALGFVWDTYIEWWEEGFKHLKAFKAREGHCRVKALHKEGEFMLGSWVGRQRTNRRDQLTEDRRSRLDALGFVWDPHTGNWEEGFRCLEAFKAREGHCRVPALHKEGEFKLSIWVASQRANREKLNEDCRRRLDDLDFVWDPLTEQWEEGFSFLLAFEAREGNCRVPRLHKEGEFKLGTWVGYQRSRRDQLTEDRRRRLDALGFVWVAR